MKQCSPVNLCITCAHFELNPEAPKNPEVGLCKRIPPKLSPVTGLPIQPANNFANVERLAHMSCGLEGKLHTPISIPFATQAEVNELLAGDPKHV
jgi:hypothetical protein